MKDGLRHPTFNEIKIWLSGWNSEFPDNKYHLKDFGYDSSGKKICSTETQWVYCEKGRPIAFASCFKPQYYPGAVQVNDVLVIREYRGKGFGKKFFLMLKKKYHNRNLILDVDSNNVRAIAFYEKLGFKIHGYTLISIRLSPGGHA
jgi:ribosomal protein S18 acetylase RimI-like enzyme